MKQRRFSWKPYESAALNARRMLPKMLRNYFDTGRKLDYDSSAKDMHGFRLKTNAEISEMTSPIGKG